MNTSPLYGLSPVITVAAATDNTRPAKPSGLTARAGDRQVKLMWNDPSDSTITKYQFQLKAGTGNYGDWTDVPGSGAGITSHIVSNLTNRIAYTFKIRAVDEGGVGTESNAVTAKPADTTPPTITGLTFGTFIGRGIDIYVVGDHIPIYVNFTEDVTVVGTPTLTINIGGVTRTAAYTPFGSSGDSKVFQYTVQHSDKDTDGISVDAGSIALPRGASIKDAANHAAVLTHNGLATQSDHKVDGVRRPAKPSFFTAHAGDRQVTLSWANHYDPTITKFQYKQKSGGGSYPTAWTDVPASSVTSVRCGIKIQSRCVGSQFYFVSNLTNGIAYTFKTRAWDASSNYGRESDEATATPAVPVLTARFSNAPTEHRGKGKFMVRVAFDASVAGRAKDAAIEVTGGTLTRAARVDRRGDLWELRIEPSSYAAVTLTLPATADCAAPGAVCTADGRRLKSALTHTVPGPATLSVADARAREGTDASIDFAVTLSRAASDEVTVRYATRNGTAKKGKDYRKAKGTLVFAAGETAKTISVALLDDAKDEGAETFTLVLKKATGAAIADGEAVGTIVNADPLPKAWLARFGRTVGTHVTDAVSERLRAAPGQGSSLTVGGYRVPLGREADAGAEQPGPEAGASASGLLRGVAGILGLGPAQSGSAGGEPPGGNLSPLDPRLRQSQSLNLDLRRLLLGSAFRLNLTGPAAGAGPRLTAWGRVAGTTFDGQDGNLAVAGDVLTGTVGVDGEWDRVLAGIAVAHSRGDGSFTDSNPGMADRGQGDMEQTLTSLHPYLRYAVTDRLDVWGLVGYGWGELDLETENGMTVETDTTLVMGAFGSRGVLLSPADTSGFQLATRADAMLTRTSSDAGADSVATDADAHRVRVILEGSRGFTWADGQSLTPTVELGLRHDWGDAETGFGLEVGGRVQYTDPRLGLTVEGAVRGLVAHEASDYEEWGASGTVRVAPGADGQGLALTLAPAWGATASGVEGLWSRQTTAGLAPQGQRGPAAGRLTAKVGYGFAAFDAGLLTPYGGMTLAQGGTQQYRLGARLAIEDGLTLNLEGAHQQQSGPTLADTGLLLRLELPW